MGSGPQVGSFDGWLGASPGAAGGGAGGGGTLASIYTFGLGDNPFVDNNFPMPAGNYRWPGNTDWGTGRQGAEAMWFQDKTKITLSEPPAFELVSQAWQNSGVGGTGCGAFEIYELLDPAWNGNFTSINGATIWTAEVITASNDNTQTSAHTNTTYGRRSYDANGLSPFIPSLGQIGNAMEAQLDLWCNNLGTIGSAQVLEVRNLTAYGSEELRMLAIQNGASAQWVSHWLNGAATPAAGDGPTWWIDKDSRFGRFDPAAGLQAYQNGASQTASPWGWRMFAFDGAALQKVLDVTPATLQFASAPWYVANGGQTVTIGAHGPAGIGTPGTPAKWLTFTDSGGVLSYIPIWQ